MDKKIIIIGILAVFMLVAISFTTSANLKKIKPIENKDSPLFRVRTSGAKKSNLILETIKTRFLEGRIFIKFPERPQELSTRQLLQGKVSFIFSCDGSCVKSINTSPACDW